MAPTDSSSTKAAELISLLNEDLVVGKRIFFKYDRNSDACRDILGGVYSVEEQNQNEEGELFDDPHESQIVIFSPLSNIDEAWDEDFYNPSDEEFYVRLETYTDHNTKFYFDRYMDDSTLQPFLAKMLDEGHICYDENETTL